VGLQHLAASSSVVVGVALFLVELLHLVLGMWVVGRNAF
jgi:hypothetical protein